MASATAFTAVSGLGALVMGATALAAAWIAHRQPSDASWLGVWLVEAGLAFGLGSAFMLRKVRRAGATLFSGPGQRFLLAYAAPMAAGVVLTGAFWRSGLAAFLPGTWLLLYGTGAVAGGASSIAPIRLAGVCFMALGAAALWAPTAWGDLFMALGFGGCHLAFGLVVFRRYGG